MLVDMQCHSPGRACLEGKQAHVDSPQGNLQIAKINGYKQWRRKVFFDEGAPIFLRTRNLISSTKHYYARNLLVKFFWSHK